MQQLHEEGPWEYGALTDTVLKSDEALVLSDAGQPTVAFISATARRMTRRWCCGPSWGGARC